jgi:sulfide:quinone oxidoreductase
MTAYRLSETCAVSSQIRPSDVADIAAGGFTTIVCNRPDNEEFGQRRRVRNTRYRVSLFTD